MPQIAVKISEPIFAKLKRLAHQGQTNYATIVESALSAYEPGASEPASDDSSEIRLLIESALQPVLARLEMLESLGFVKHSHPSSITVEIKPQEADLSASETQPISEPGSAEITPEIAPQAAKSAGANNPSKPTVKAFIADRVAAGERSPAKIAKALNAAGYRTGTGSEFQRSNPQISGALKTKD